MARKYIQNVVPQGMREQASLIRNAKKSLSRFDKRLDPDDLAKVLQALNGISDLLGDRKPDEVENECDCADGEDCDCSETVAKNPQATMDTRSHAALARDWERDRGTAAVVNELRRNNRDYRVNAKHDTREMSIIRNTASTHFLKDEDLVGIAARNSRTRKR